MSGLLQTMLFVPGSDERKLAKIDSLDAPAFILDLEDAVAVAAKAQARAAVSALLDARPARRVYVRVNSVRSGLLLDDLIAVAGPNLAGIVLPKVESGDDVKLVDRHLSVLEGERRLEPGKIEVIATIETAAGVEHAREIATAAPRVRCLGFGAGDFCLDLGLEWPPPDGRLSETVIGAKVAVVMASRLAGLEPPHDGVFPDFRDLEGLRTEAEHARLLGFYGKHAIHPDQLEVIKHVFTPGQREIARAREIVDAFDRSERAGIAAIQLNGVLIDYPVAERARRLLALAGDAGSKRAER